MELINDEKDKALWRTAKKRAGFKSNLLSYIIIIPFLWGVWYFTTGWDSYPWPIWPMMGWGIGLAFHYFGAYHMDKNDMVNREYEKLKREQGQTK